MLNGSNGFFPDYSVQPYMRYAEFLICKKVNPKYQDNKQVDEQ